MIAFAVGARSGTGTPKTPAAKAAAIDATLRCPSCTDLSVTQSDAVTAVAIRRYVKKEVDAGQSKDQIVSYLEGRYGPSILLTPPKSGRGIALWWFPVAAVVLAAGGVGTRFLMRRRAEMLARPAELSDEDKALVEAALRGES